MASRLEESTLTSDETQIRICPLSWRLLTRMSILPTLPLASLYTEETDREKQERSAMQQGRHQRRDADLHGRQGRRQDRPQALQQRVHRAPWPGILLHVQGPRQRERLRWIGRLVQSVS